MFPSMDRANGTRAPPDDTGDGESGGATTLTGELLFPNHWCLISSILSGTWTSQAGTLLLRQQQQPFHRVSQTLLHVAQCTIFVMWARLYSDVCFVATGKKEKKRKEGRKDPEEPNATLNLLPKVVTPFTSV